jgi:hypothetical protein
MNRDQGGKGTSGGWHGRLGRVPGIEGPEVDRLKRKYPDQNALQAVLDDNSDSPPIQRVAKDANLDAKRVAELLGASLQQSADPLLSGWLDRHWADLLLIAGIVFLAMLPKFGTMVDPGKKARAAAEAAKPHVIARRDLLPYMPLEAGDLQAMNASSSEAGSKLVVGLTDRYPKQPIKKGQTIDAASLSEATAALKQFSVLRVGLKLKPVLEGRPLPSSANLLLSSRSTPPSGAVFPIQLLNVESDGLTATVAVRDEHVAEAAKWVGNSDAFLSFPIR